MIEDGFTTKALRHEGNEGELTTEGTEDTEEITEKDGRVFLFFGFLLRDFLCALCGLCG